MTTQVASNENGIESRGRKPIFENNRKLVELLKLIRDGEAQLTHYMKHQLVDEGYLTLTRVSPPNGGRGRPTEKPELTGKARQLIGRFAGLDAIAAKRAA